MKSIGEGTILLWVICIIIALSSFLSGDFSEGKDKSKEKYTFGCIFPSLLILTALVLTVLHIAGVINLG